MSTLLTLLLREGEKNQSQFFTGTACGFLTRIQQPQWARHIILAFGAEKTEAEKDEGACSVQPPGTELSLGRQEGPPH